MDSGFVSATLLIFLVLDPFGNIPLVAQAVVNVVPARRPRVILRECLIAYGVLLVFLFFGQHLLGALKLSQTSLGLAGGVVLFIIALHMIFPTPGGVFGEPGAGEPLIVPIAIPAIAGPSAMALVMLMASQEPGRLFEWGVALTLAMAMTTIPLVASAKLLEALGPRVTTAMERLTGLVLSVLAVEMILQGIRDFWRSLH